MNTRCNPITPHPKLLDLLFALKKRSARVFNDVLGLHEMDHVAISWVSEHRQLMILSSTPSLEFNLFSQQLWRGDRSYSLDWMAKQRLATWPDLYHPACHYELLYYKQLKTHYRQGYSLATAVENQPLVFSYASRKETEAGDISSDLYKMGFYCVSLLQPLVEQFNA